MDNKQITKSRYVDYIACPRMFYYTLHNEDEANLSDDYINSLMQEGILVGRWAHKYFPDTHKVKLNEKDDNYKLHLEITQKLIKEGVDVISEATFAYDDLFCAVDLLKKNGDGYDIYEVKACGENIKKHLPSYIPDIAFQKYVLTKCGINVKHCYIMHLNSAYVRNGDIDVKQLFVIDSFTYDETFNEHYKHVEENIDEVRRILNLTKAPEYGEKCGSTCPYLKFCHSDLPYPNVVFINGIHKKEAHELIKQGVVTYEQALKAQVKSVERNPRRKAQVQIGASGLTRQFDKAALTSFLKGLKYPLYHLDFETYSQAVPPFDGAHPFQVVPFQYSLHIEKSPGGELIHKEFLANDFNEMEEIAKRLCEEIPIDGMIIAFHVSTEQGILRALAKLFPKYENHLNTIADHAVDLWKVFTSGIYYDVKQGGSNSIKYVMPALCPNMEDAYHALPFVHNGGEAMTAFPKMMENKNDPKYQEKREGMLRYCELDTLSMVEILKVLWDAIK